MFISGHSTGMELPVILRNIERLLEVHDLSAHKASRLAKHPDLIRNLRRKVRRGESGSLRADTLEALARVLHTTAQDLTRPDKAAPMAPVPGLRDILLAQRALIDDQLAQLDAAEFTAQKAMKRKHR